MPSTNTLIVWAPGNEVGALRWVHDGEKLYGSHGHGDDFGFQLEGKAPVDWLRQYYKDGINIEPAERDAGQYYPRFYKGGYFLNLDDTAGPEYDREACAASYEQEDILVEDLKAICRVATPDDATSTVYGSRIRNLLILAATEVEALIKGTLANSHYRRADGNHWTMTDYVKVAGPMRLGEYAQKLRAYRNYAEFRPFAGWIDNNTKPDWYEAYTAAKHDREGAISRATLKHAVSAVAAVNIMLIAQYGEEIRSGQSFFQTTARPTWGPPERTYSDPVAGRWRAVNYPF